MSGKPFTITPIGSCRISGPLRSGQRCFDYQINKGRSYGYTHSSLEAVQQLRFMQDRYRPSEDAWPLMSLNHGLDDLKRDEHHEANLYLVEISTPKQLTFRGHAIQSNYLQKRFKEFFSDRERAVSYWEAVDSQDTQNWLEQNWAGAERRPDREILRDIQRTFTSPDILERHLLELQQSLPEIVVVTHVDARKVNGEKIASRSQFISLVKQTCDKLGIPCYDPTVLMELRGQSNAIEDESSSLAHYTKDFEAELLKDILGFVGINDYPSAGSLIERARWFEHNGRTDNSLGLAIDLFQQTPSAARAQWIVDLCDQASSKEAMPVETIIEIAEQLDFGTAYKVCSNADAQTAVIAAARTDTQRTEICAALSEVHSFQDALGIAKLLHAKCQDRTAFETTLACVVPAWLEAANEQDDPIERLDHLITLHELVPGNRSVKLAVRDAKRALHREAKQAFAERDFAHLDRLAKVNSDANLELIEIDVLWCRSLQLRKNYKASISVAEGLLENRPDHLTSWILLMRALVKTGQMQQAIQAAQRVQDIGQKDSPKHVVEAQKILNAA